MSAFKFIYSSVMTIVNVTACQECVFLMYLYQHSTDNSGSFLPYCNLCPLLPFIALLERQKIGSFKSLHILSRKLNLKSINCLLIILLPSVKLFLKAKFPLWKG